MFFVRFAICFRANQKLKKTNYTFRCSLPLRTHTNGFSGIYDIPSIQEEKNQVRISEEEDGKSIYELPHAVSIDKRHMWNCRKNRTLPQCIAAVQSGKT